MQKYKNIRKNQVLAMAGSICCFRRKKAIVAKHIYNNIHTTIKKKPSFGGGGLHMLQTHVYYIKYKKNNIKYKKNNIKKT